MQVRLSVPDLESIALDGAEQFVSAENVALYTAIQVLCRFLGDRWVEANIMSQPAKEVIGRTENRQFIAMSYAPFSDRKMEMQRRTRITRLAECIFSLQDAPGFAHRLEILKVERIESVLGELECAAFFSQHAGFRFIVPTGVKGKDYECEFMTRKGQTVYCEIKTKYTATALRKQTAWSTINDAMKQLPKGKPCIVVLKFPEHWASNEGSQALYHAFLKAARQSQRLVAVVLAWEKWITLGENWWGCSYRYKAVCNGRSKFLTQDILDALDLSAKWRELSSINFMLLGHRAIAASPVICAATPVIILIEGFDPLPDSLDWQDDYP